MCTFSAHIAFDEATNGQADIKHEMGKTISSMSLLKIVGLGEKLPPWRKSIFGNEFRSEVRHTEAL